MQIEPVKSCDEEDFLFDYDVDEDELGEMVDDFSDDYVFWGDIKPNERLIMNYPEGDHLSNYELDIDEDDYDESDESEGSYFNGNYEKLLFDEESGDGSTKEVSFKEKSPKISTEILIVENLSSDDEEFSIDETNNKNTSVTFFVDELWSGEECSDERSFLDGLSNQRLIIEELSADEEEESFDEKCSRNETSNEILIVEQLSDDQETKENTKGSSETFTIDGSSSGNESFIKSNCSLEKDKCSEKMIAEESLCQKESCKEEMNKDSSPNCSTLLINETIKEFTSAQQQQESEENVHKNSFTKSELSTQKDSLNKECTHTKIIDENCSEMLPEDMSQESSIELSWLPKYYYRAMFFKGKAKKSKIEWSITDMENESIHNQLQQPNDIEFDQCKFKANKSGFNIENNRTFLDTIMEDIAEDTNTDTNMIAYETARSSSVRPSVTRASMAKNLDSIITTTNCDTFYTCVETFQVNDDENETTIKNSDDSATIIVDNESVRLENESHLNQTDEQCKSILMNDDDDRAILAACKPIRRSSIRKSSTITPSMMKEAAPNKSQILNRRKSRSLLLSNVLYSKLQPTNTPNWFIPGVATSTPKRFD